LNGFVFKALHGVSETITGFGNHFNGFYLLRSCFRVFSNPNPETASEPQLRREAQNRFSIPSEGELNHCFLKPVWILKTRDWGLKVKPVTGVFKNP
jgi:hypothetical protein